jgi:hypothetical protein
MVLLGIVTGGAGKLWPPRPLPEGVESPILAIELLRPGVRLDSFVFENPVADPTRKSEREQLAWAVRIDVGFIVAYGLFLMILGVAQSGPVRRPLGLVVAAGAVAGAVFDGVENWRMLALLEAGSVPPESLPRGPSQIKWWCLFAATIAIAALAVDRGAPLLRRWIGYAGAMVALMAAGGGIFGLFYQNDQFIETAIGRLAVAWFLAYLFAATKHSLRDGPTGSPDGRCSRRSRPGRMPIAITQLESGSSIPARCVEPGPTSVGT